MAKVTDFSKDLSTRYGVSQDAAMDFIESMFDVVKQELYEANKSVKIKGLGTFKVTDVGARTSVDVNTGDKIIIEGRNKISFTPDVTMRDRVNRPFAQFETVALNDGVNFSGIDNNELELAENTTEKASSTIDTHTDNTSSEIAQSDDNSTQETKEAVTTDEKISATKKDIQEEPNVDSDLIKNKDSALAVSVIKETAERLMRIPQPVCKQRNPHLMYWLTAVSFVLLIVIGIGLYAVYNKIEAKNNAIEQIQKKIIAQNTKHDVAPITRKVNKTEKIVSHKNTTFEKKNIDSLYEKDGGTMNRIDREKINPIPKSSASDYNYDARVRTGAYLIVGTDKIITVKAGQTLASISKAHLGAGMECYVEVYNNCKTVKQGDKIKIPKLKIKPRH